MNRHKTESTSVSDSALEGLSRISKKWDALLTPRRPLFVEKWLVRQILEALGELPVEIALWNNMNFTGEQTPPRTRIVIRDRAALWKLSAYPELQFGELFSAGRIQVKGNLVELLESLDRAHPLGESSLRGKILNWLFRPRHNTLVRARNNIHHHYDLGNEFYKLWLDKNMVYTCAYYPSPSASLEKAQLAKMELVCKKLRLRAGEAVVEAGCGWGSLALYMAKHYGVKVKAYNISKAQITYAQERARIERLDDKVEYIAGDYREITGEYDVFVSVGMLEHVGLSNHQRLGEVIDRSLKRGGRGLIHSIGRDKPTLMNAWIEKRIFPGAYPPSLGEMIKIFEPWHMSVLDVENLRLHYVKTLEHWLARFEAAKDRVREMYDEAFVRAWRLYLSGSISAFSTGKLQLYQVIFTRSGDNNIPWTRAYLYTD